MSVLQKRINLFAEDVERIFNFTACVPLLGTQTSVLRVYFGVSQVVLGAIVQISGCFGVLLTSLGNENGNKKWIKMVAFGSEHLIQGCLNALRGLGELFVSLGTLGLGNVVLFIPNTMLEDSFAPCVPYGKIYQNLKEEMA